MAEKKQLSDKEIKKALLASIKYVAANLMTSFLIMAMLFVISVIIGLESDEGINFLNGASFQTIMLPLIIWYYGYLAFKDGYKDSVAGKYNKNKILISALPIFLLQTITVLLAIREGASATELGAAKTVALFLLNPFTIIFNTFPELMPEIMLLPCIILPVVLYIGYYFARFKEVKDHSMSQSAQDFRKQLEKIQYERKNTNGDNQ